MFERKREGSVVCPSCRNLVGVKDEVCYNCGRRNPGMWGYAQVFQALGNDLGFLPFVFYGCILMYVLTLAYDPAGIGAGGLLGMLSPSPKATLVFGASGWYPFFVLDRWWTVLSASFLHGGLLHIFFNLYWARLLLPAATTLFGVSRAVIIFTAASIGGFMLSSVMYTVFGGIPVIGGAQLTLGASAAIFGLLGALVNSNSSVAAQAKYMAIFVAVLGLIIPGVDNWAHAGGFVAGYLLAGFYSKADRESQGELFLAIACIAAFVLSIVVSFLDAQSLPLERIFGG
ncbi:MAG TPA: rhomboid family intramembrane serine protease [Acidobacteriota bacterium]|nr:rhomboid family intramembrane serine protease [Acidobacteriota bacterium]